MTELRLPDGRRLEWLSAGDSSGRPVVFLHGTPQSRLYRPPDSALDGIQLVTFDRPGYGRSSPALRQTLTRVARDVERLAGDRGWDRFGVVGFSGGAPYALACAAVLGARLTGVAAAALTGPDRELDSLPNSERRTVWLLRNVPGRGRRYVSQAASAFLSSENAVPDGDPYAVPSGQSSVESRRQGTAGLVGDWMATDIRRWGFRLRDISVPVLIWAGRKDPGRAVTDAPLVADRMRTATVVIDDDAGHTPSPEAWRLLLTTAAGLREDAAQRDTA